MIYKNLSLQKERIKNFLRKNQKATWKDIRVKLRIHLERVYKKGMDEAFKDAGIKPPRNFKHKTKEENRKIIINYIKKYPKVGGHILRKETKINYLTVFKNIKEIYNEAGVIYPRDKMIKLRKRSSEYKKKMVLSLVKKDPLISVTEITEKVKTHPYNIFKNMKEIYNEAGVKFISKSRKRKFKKRKIIINYIKKNPLSTQREINNECKTHVQDIFDNGIFRAYKIAGVNFPYKRLKLYGTATKKIRKRSKNFEDLISIKLQGYGKVNRLVKTKRGVADIILERKNKKAVIEIKDYQAKEISVSQVNQLLKYLEDCNCNLGILICHNKPKKDRFLFGNNKIFIIEKSELNKIPILMGV